MADVTYSSDITVTPIDGYGSDQHIIGAMRVMKELPPPEIKTDRGRIMYLMKHRHGTPFEHNAITLHIHAPIFVWREWHRHRIGFSYNEESARYSQLEPVFFLPSFDRRMFKVQDEEFRPSRPKFWNRHDLAEFIARDMPYMSATEYVNDVVTSQTDRMVDIYRRAYDAYEAGLHSGFDPGLARDVLPVGIYSSCWVTCNLRSALAFLSLRTHEPAAAYVSYPLAEIEAGARQLEAYVKDRFPLAHEAFVACGRVAP